MAHEPETIGPGTPSRRARRRSATAGVMLLVLTAAVGVGCGADAPDSDAGARVVVDGDPQQADAAPGRIHVRLEQVEGVFVEGFEVGLRFETGAGEVIAATLWSDFVSSTGRTDVDAYDDSVLTQPVPAGAVQVSAEVNVGIGPGSSVPDLDGPPRPSRGAPAGVGGPAGTWSCPSSGAQPT